MIAATLICLVIGIGDGDSLTVRCGAGHVHQPMRVRIAAIDAPERGQPYSQQSRKMLAALCHRQMVRITVSTTDHYGRAVADVQCRGQDAGRHMVRNGMAWVYTRYAHAHAYLRPLQQTAQAQRLGLWQATGSNKPPVPPWVWRARQAAYRERLIPQGLTRL